jgi:pimeloyl-ACP methyl ester carboxylesterase/DNA-binding CsgD family transcriptional regulator
MAMLRPPVRYARTSDGVTIAYSEFGDGPVTIVTLAPAVSQLEVAWGEPRFEHFMSRLGSVAHVVMLDRRGTGLSDHATASGEQLSLQALADDVLAVLDATSTERVVLCGMSMGSMVAVQFAADHPDRTDAVVLIAGTARISAAPDFPIGLSSDALDGWIDYIIDGWGSGISVEADAPPMRDDPRYREWAGRLERHSCSPGMVAAMLRKAADYDVRPHLAGLAAPALVLHRRADRGVSVEHGRYLAANLRDVTYVELDGDDHTFFLGDHDALLDATFDFLDARVADGRIGDRLRAAKRRGDYGYGWESLTAPEREIASLAASGLTNVAIAEELRMSRHTVDGRLRRVFAKLDVTSRVELAAEYARAGT